VLDVDVEMVHPAYEPLTKDVIRVVRDRVSQVYCVIEGWCAGKRKRNPPVIQEYLAHVGSPELEVQDDIPEVTA
jgi:hypothetical protein